jgi:hypothetical protein
VTLRIGGPWPASSPFRGCRLVSAEGLLSGAGRLSAPFDTRIDKPAFLTGSAAKGIARRLKDHGYRLIVRPESLFISINNTLLEGEANHAVTWGVALAERATAGLIIH